MSSIAIITARGGSKRIPKKNIKDFCGKPIISYSIEAALESELFEEVMVSTDSEEIADVARSYGASVPFLRSENTSDDYATTTDVLLEVIKEYESRGRLFEWLACIYPTAPFVTASCLNEAFKLTSNCDSVIPVVRYSFPPQRSFIITDGSLRYMYPEYEKVRSQDLESIYHDCGQFYLCKSSLLRETGSIITENTKPYIRPEELVQDIDNESDWTLAELKYHNMLINVD